MERNPWDSAVQFKDELIRKTFPADSGFSASYKFTIESAVPKNLAIVIERPDLYTITCNGQPVKANRNDWWLDKAFGRIDIASAARTGENVVTIKASPFTMYHELEPAYVLGDFALKPADKGFVITPDQGLALGTTSQATAASSPTGLEPTRASFLQRGRFLPGAVRRGEARGPVHCSPAQLVWQRRQSGRQWQGCRLH